MKFPKPPKEGTSEYQAYQRGMEAALCWFIMNVKDPSGKHILLDFRNFWRDINANPSD